MPVRAPRVDEPSQCAKSVLSPQSKYKLLSLYHRHQNEESRLFAVIENFPLVIAGCFLS